MILQKKWSKYQCASATYGTKSYKEKSVNPSHSTKIKSPLTKKVLHNNNNNNNNDNNNNKENNNIDIETIPFPNTTKLVARSVYKSKTAKQFQQYHHSIMGAFPVKTYLEAIKEGWLSSFPGLSSEAVKKHLLKSAQTVMGHLHMIRKGT